MVATSQARRRLAGLMGAESALVFSTGYQTNLGIVAALAGRNAIVMQDRLNHASLVDASQLSGSQMVRLPTISSSASSMTSVEVMPDDSAGAPALLLVREIESVRRRCWPLSPLARSASRAA